ncbi:MAG TPA: calcium/sodium antiporter, partial [Chthonomonadales bacterium]|nr:calcium/sodium antiporter [Chthonomonadales bacterium]
MDWIWLLAGVACAAIGGEAFLRGAVGIARGARVPPGIVGATVSAFATSSPELSVSISAALKGAPAVALGDAVGSNVVNVGVVLAMGILIAPLWAPRDGLQRDFPVALLVPIFTVLIALDGTISRVDAVAMLGLFIAWLGFTAVAARRARDATDEVLGVPIGMAIVLSAVGLLFLVVAGRLIVMGAVAIATRAGLDPFVIGATVVAVGTSTPELATVVLARLRGHQEIALGTVVGSNIFNGLFIVGVAATIHPIPVDLTSLAAGLGFGALLVAMIYPPRS